MRCRRITPRLLLTYTAALGLLILADPWAPTFTLGCVMVAIGLALRIWSFGHLRKNQELITSGPYSHTRNPAYLGSAIIMTALFIAAGNPDTTSGIAIWAAGLIGLYIFFTRYLPRKYHREYGKLREIFGEALDRHAANVPHFFPRITPWRGGESQRFSWQCVYANHELVWPAVCMLALAVIWLK